MADPPSKVRRGPPTLKDGESSREFCIRVPVSDYEKARAIAQQHAMSVAAVYRAAFRVATRQQDKLA